MKYTSNVFTVAIANPSDYAGWPDLYVERIFAGDYTKPTTFQQPENGLLAYTSGAIDPSTGKLYVFGGGHADWYGNEVWEFDVGTRAWSRHYAPSWGYNPPLASVQAAVDNANYPGAYLKDQYGATILKPIGRHTYHSVVWAANVGRLIAGGASTYGGSGAGDYLWLPPVAPGPGAYYNSPADTWQYDPSTKTWAFKGSELLTSTFRQPNNASYHTTRGRVFSVGRNVGNQFYVWEYDPTGNTVTTHTPTTNLPTADYQACIAGVDSANDRIIVLGVRDNTTIHVWTYDITLGKAGSSSAWVQRTTSGTQPPSFWSGGFMEGWKVLKTATRIVLLCGLDKSVYELNPSTWAWSKIIANALPDSHYNSQYFCASYDSTRNVVFVPYVNSANLVDVYGMRV